jgi:hypothetical protein
MVQLWQERALQIPVVFEKKKNLVLWRKTVKITTEGGMCVWLDGKYE